MRTVIRWPNGQPPPPYGCRWCGYPGPHGRQYVSGQGMHGFEPPTSAQILARMRARRAARKAFCRCPGDDDGPRLFAPVTDPYTCEANDCRYPFPELNPFGGRPAREPGARVWRVCGCGWSTGTWHADDGSADEDLHRHVVRAHDGTYPEHRTTKGGA